MNRSLGLVCALIVHVAAWIAPASHAQEAPILEGSYALVPEESADIAAAIDTAVAKMNFIKRPIARNRLNKTNTAYQRIRLARTPGEIEIAFDDRKPIRMPASGTPIKWTREDGEVFDVSIQPKGAQLVQTYKAEDGTRVNTYRWNEAGHMQLDVMVMSGQLPEPLRYTLAYRKVE